MPARFDSRGPGSNVAAEAHYQTECDLCGLAAAALVAVVLAYPRVGSLYYVIQARRALKVRSNEAALAQLEKAERLNPDPGEIQFLLVRTQRRLGRLDLGASTSPARPLWGSASNV